MPESQNCTGYFLFLVNCKRILYERWFSKNTFKTGQEKTVMILVTTWNVFARGEERKPVGNRSTTLIPTSWWNNRLYFLLTIVRWADKPFLTKPTNQLISLGLKLLIRKRIEPPKFLSTCLTVNLGTLHVISRKPKIWQKSFREASPRFYEQITQANIGFVWLNRNFLWCQDGTFDDANHFLMNLAIPSNSDIFCFGGSDKEMSNNESKLHYSFKTKMIKSKVPLVIRTGRAKLKFPGHQLGTWRHGGMVDRRMVDLHRPKDENYVSQNPIFTYL